LKSVTENVKRGKSLSESMANSPKIFSSLFVAMIKVGEEGGN
jgi:type II secretory pathway component PulF